MTDHNKTISIAEKYQAQPRPFGNVNMSPWLLAAAVIKMAGELEARRQELAKLYRRQRHRANLWGALRRFGQHRYDCPQSEHQGRPCTCGFSLALRQQP